MEKKDKTFFVIACLLGMTAVIFGAFGAHGFKNMLLENQSDMYNLEIYNKGVQYQFYHTFAIFCSLLIPSAERRKKRISAIFFLIGILLFSGSLYLLAFRDLIPIPTTIIGPLTPIGGIFFILGWATLLINAIRIKTNNQIYEREL